jgi:hypothetical protein
MPSSDNLSPSVTASRAATAAATLVTAVMLTVGIAGCKSTAPATDDTTVAAALQSRLAADGALHNETIQSAVQNGVATLNGAVSSDAARALAANDAAQVAGIRTVVNNLTVQAPASLAAETPAPTVTPAAQPVAPIRTPAHASIPRKPSPAMRDTEMANSAPAPAAPAPVERPAPVEQAPPPPPPAPTIHNITIASGSTIPVRITQTLDSASTQQGDTFTGSVATDVIIDGMVAIAQGTPVTGRVTEVHEAAHYKGSSLLSIELTNINRHGEHLPVTTEAFSKEGAGRGKNTAEKVGGGAAVGAILGGIFGGGKGAAVGAAAGGGLGAGANTVTRGQQVQIPSETLVRFRLSDAIIVHVSSKDIASPNSDSQRRPLDTPQ